MSKHIKDIIVDNVHASNGPLNTSSLRYSGVMKTFVTVTPAVTLGDVLMADSSNDRQVEKTASTNEVIIVGVATEDGAAGSRIKIAVSGVFQVKVIGAVTRGDLLTSSGTDGVAEAVGDSPGNFAIAMNSDADTGIKLVWARYTRAESW